MLVASKSTKLQGLKKQLNSSNHDNSLALEAREYLKISMEGPSFLCDPIINIKT